MEQIAQNLGKKLAKVADILVFRGLSGVMEAVCSGFKERVADLTKEIEINPNHAFAFYNRGVAKFKLKDYIGTISDMTQAIKINPNIAEAYYLRGLVQLYAKQRKNAYADLSKAGELGNAAAYELIKKHFSIN